jgi:hypothetical protein
MAGRRLYKYVSIVGLKRMINGSVRFTQPGAFNDPFELLPELVTHKDTVERQVSLSFDVYADRRTPPVGDVLEVGEDFVCSDLTSRNIVRELDKIVGIFCVSEASDSILMWSHYADQYTGAVVGFDADHEFFQRQFSMEYLKSRPRKDYSSYLASPVPLSELCAKSDHWAYEREVRIIRLLGDCKDTRKTDVRNFSIFTQKLPDDCMKTITFGERTSIRDQRDIYALVKNTQIGLALSAVDNTGYGFRQEIIKYPDALGIMGPSVSPRTAHIWSDEKTNLGGMARAMIEKHPASKIVNNLA